MTMPMETHFAPAPRVQLGPPGRRYALTGVVAVAAFGAFMAFLDSTVVNVAFPNIQASFPHTVGRDSLSWVLNAYNVVFAGLLVLSGRFADLLGRRRLFKMGLVVFTRRLGPVCGVHLDRDADRLPSRPGRRRGDARARLPRHRGARLTRRSGAPTRSACGPPRPPSPPARAPRSAARWSISTTGAWSSSSTSPSACWPGSWPAGW